MMQAREGVKFPDDAEDYKFELTGGMFAGQPVAKWIFEFPERKFASATVILKNTGSATTLHKDFRAKLVDKYGTATTDRKLGKGRRSDNPALTGTATVWKFVPNITDKSSLSITCEVAGPGGQPTADEDKLMVSIRYVNDTLVAAAAANIAVPPKEKPQPVKKDEL
jgi:hypothetical protein